MIVNGTALAETIYEEVKALVTTLQSPPVLVAVTCAPTFETKKYLSLKQRHAAKFGITLSIVELPQDITTCAAIEEIATLANNATGIVVQLPFPSHIDREAVLRAVPTHKDPDGFSYGVDEAACTPPVVGAIDYIARRHGVTFRGKRVVVLGQGRLVGAPAARFLRAAGAQVTTVTEADADIHEHLCTADIIVSGVGKAHLVTADDVAVGTVVFDAGTSEDGGLMVGDVHPAVADKASLFTPVPGGIGPITVALLLHNLVLLAAR